jgi:hypothetical protein
MKVCSSAPDTELFVTRCAKSMYLLLRFENVVVYYAVFILVSHSFVPAKVAIA